MEWQHQDCDVCCGEHDHPHQECYLPPPLCLLRGGGKYHSCAATCMSCIPVSRPRESEQSGVTQPWDYTHSDTVPCKGYGEL